MSSYLVTRCGSCGHVCLATTELVRGGAPPCSACGRVTAIVPSCVYGESDVSLFEELSQTVREGGISALEAARLVSELARALNTGAYDAFLELLSSRMPGFTPIQLILGRKPNAQLRALRMLATIFEALATTARSGTLPAMQRPPLSAVGREI